MRLDIVVIKKYFETLLNMGVTIYSDKGELLPYTAILRMTHYQGEVFYIYQKDLGYYGLSFNKRGVTFKGLDSQIKLRGYCVLSDLLYISKTLKPLTNLTNTTKNKKFSLDLFNKNIHKDLDSSTTFKINSATNTLILERPKGFTQIYAAFLFRLQVYVADYVSTLMELGVEDIPEELHTFCGKQNNNK